MKAILPLAIFPVLIFSVSQNALGSEVGFSHSQSSSTSSDKFKMSYNFNSQNKLGASYKVGKDTTGTLADDKTSTAKLSYRYKTEGGSSYTLGFTSTDESYFYDGKALSLRASIPVAEWEVDKKNILKTKLILGYEGSEKKYSKITAETLAVRSFSVGIDQDITRNISGGIEFTGYGYTASGFQGKMALDGKTIAEQNISSYFASLSSSSATLYLELNIDDWALGASFTQDVDYLTGTKTSTSEVYCDYTFLQDWSVSLSYSVDRTQGSTSTTQSTSLGLAYAF